MQILTNQQKGFECLKEFLESELGDYSHTFSYKIEPSEEDDPVFYYDVEILKDDERHQCLSFKYEADSNKLFVDLCEDSWEEITTYDWRVKYFWITFRWE